MTHFEDPEVLARVSSGLKDAMAGHRDLARSAQGDLLQGRGW